MDQEIASFKLNINQLAGITGVHRQTVAARLKNVEPAPGSNAKLKLFQIGELLAHTDVEDRFSRYGTNG